MLRDGDRQIGPPGTPAAVARLKDSVPEENGDLAGLAGPHAVVRPIAYLDSACWNACDFLVPDLAIRRRAHTCYTGAVARKPDQSA
jgi:hypothetical protein